MSHNNKEIQKLISKIVKARKIQKHQLEGEIAADTLKEEKIAKFQQPLVKEIAEQTKNTIEALQHQRTQLAQIENKLTPLQMHPPQPAIAAQKFQDEQNSVKDDQRASTTSQANDPKWVQTFYQKHKKAQTTKLEADLNGKFGTAGYLDMIDLFNHGNMRLRAGKREYEIQKENITLGLVALFLLPYDDLKASKVRITNGDVEIYKSLMIMAGIKGSTQNRKYREYLRGTEKQQAIFEQEREADVLEKSRQDYFQEREDEDVRNFLELPPKKKMGKGFCKPYKTVQDLTERLEVLLGSINVGNTSSEVRNEARHILDKLLEMKEILPVIHRKLFVKFKL